MESSARVRASRAFRALLVLAAVCAAPQHALATEGDEAAPKTLSAPEPWPAGGAKRIRPPEPGTTKRITVQLTEIPDFRERRGPMTIPPGPGGAWTEDEGPRLPGVYDWYWTVVSPSLAQSGPSRVARAIDTVARPPADAPTLTPRLQSLQRIADMHGVEILTATVGTRVSPALVLAMISVESAGRPDAVSSAGAAGLMQLMPATAERFGVSDRMRPEQNIRGGVAYMDWLLKEFEGDAVMALAGYNAGENAVKNHGGVPPYAETRAYVPKVLAAWTVARGLCLTPPQLLSDPCVFVGRQTASAD